MSTTFNGLNKLYSSIKISKEHPYTKITLFVKGQNIGTIRLKESEVIDFLRLQFDRPGVAFRASHKISRAKTLDPDEQILSEYGDVTTYRAEYVDFKQRADGL